MSSGHISYVPGLDPAAWYVRVGARCARRHADMSMGTATAQYKSLRLRMAGWGRTYSDPVLFPIRERSRYLYHLFSQRHRHGHGPRLGFAHSFRVPVGVSLLICDCYKWRQRGGGAQTIDQPRSGKFQVGPPE